MAEPQPRRVSAAGREAGAVEWSPGAGPRRAEAAGQPLLEPAEIEGLLRAGRDGALTGVAALINNGTVNHERLPMLEVVFDRLVRILTTSLRNFTSENVELSLEAITSMRFGDYLDTLPLPAIIAVFKAVEWDNYGLLSLSNPLIYSTVDVLLGGRRGVAPLRIEGRPFTSIERTLIERLIRLVLADLGVAFEPVSAVEFRYERLETNPALRRDRAADQRRRAVPAARADRRPRRPARRAHSLCHARARARPPAADVHG